MREDRQDAGELFRCSAVDIANSATGDRAAYHCSKNLAGHIELGRVSRRTGDLLPTINSTKWLAYCCGCHVRAPAISIARTMARCMSSTLNSLWPLGWASSAARLAAWRSSGGSKLA